MHFKSFPIDRQLDMMDCGPACLKMICKYYGKYYSLQHLRDLCGVTKEGVSTLDLSYAAEKLGLRTLSMKCTISDLLRKISLPVILHWDNSHFVVVYQTNVKKTKFTLLTLLKGMFRIPLKIFRKSGTKRKKTKRVF